MVGNYITHRLNLEEEEVFGVCMIIEKRETIRNETKRNVRIYLSTSPNWYGQHKNKHLIE